MEQGDRNRIKEELTKALPKELVDALFKPHVIDQVIAEQMFGPGKAVGMNEYADVGVKDRIYTTGMGGCICVVARKGDTIRLMHMGGIEQILHPLMSFYPEYSIAFVVGEHKWISGRWQVRAEDTSQNRMLQSMCDVVVGYTRKMRQIYHTDAVFYEPPDIQYTDGKIIAFNEILQMK